MPISVGATSPTGIYVGATPVQQVYLGSIPLLGSPPSGAILTAIDYNTGKGTSNPTDLTAIGTLDWAHWGATSANEMNVKIDGPGIISNQTALIRRTWGRYSNLSRGYYTWTNGSIYLTYGAPSGRVQSGDRVVGAGMSLSIEASTNTRTAYIYLGGDNSFTKVTLTLSGGGASPVVFEYVPSSSAEGSTSYDRTVEVTYRASSPGQTLDVRYETRIAATSNLGIFAVAVSEP